MKVALLHDYLNQWGGGERVLAALADMFPDAPIYTLLHDVKATGGRFAAREVRTSMLDASFIRKRHRWFIPLMPLAAGVMKIKDCDLVISSSAGFAKGVAVPKGAKHLAYIHSPLRYAWDETYIADELRHMKPFSRLHHSLLAPAVSPIVSYLRAWDKRAAQKPDILLANSSFIAGQVRRYYGREARVLYPPVDTEFFSYDKAAKTSDYFLAVGRLIGYKKFDVIIEAFKALGFPLKIVGVGRDAARLAAHVLAPNIEFLGSVSDERLRELYREAKALIVPQVEDFGLVTAESIACGTPVVAYAGGGSLEIVEDKTSGVFFREQTPGALANAVRVCAAKTWNRALIAKTAEKFSRESFEKGIRAAITRI